MSSSAIFTLVYQMFFVLGGITVFMIGMEQLGANIEKAAGKGMRKIMSKATRNRFTGVGTGLAVTAIVNSSSATTVMIVGFVNVGIMTLVQAAPVIMGANIGTTITAFITALATAGGVSLNVSAIFALVAFIGLLLTLFGRTDSLKRVGNILVGFGMIFIGLNVISSAVKTLIADAEISQVINNVFISLGKGKEVLTWECVVLFIIGAVLTAVLQSSSALTAIVITLASTGLITLPMAMFITMGTNVGTCVTSMISSIGTNTNARRAAGFHLLFNILGCLLFFFPVFFFGAQIATFLNNITTETQWQIAIFHMFFNVITTCILLPFIKYLIKAVEWAIKEKKATKEEELLDVRLLKTPPIAVGQARKEIVKMGQLAFANYKRSLDMLLNGDMRSKGEFDATEEKINKLNKYITNFLVKVSSVDISEIDERKVSSFYHVVSDIERIGDYATNITEYAEQMVDGNFKFSAHAMDEIREMDLHITKLYENVEHVFSERDTSLIRIVEQEENEVDRMKELMQESHLRRMNEGRCNAEVGAVFLQLAGNMERIGDHMYNISNSINLYVK